MTENPFELYEEEHQETLGKIEIESENHVNLFEAMGKEKYLSFLYGEGLKSNPKLQAELSKNGFTNARYSIGTFKNESGQDETSLFISNEFPSNTVIYECNIDSKKTPLFEYLPYVKPFDVKPFDIYEAKHIYVLGKNGEAVDLMEELESTKTKLMLCPNKRFLTLGADITENLILIPDLRKFTESTGYMSDFPVVLHEIGHIKHQKVEPNVFIKQRPASMRLMLMLGLNRSKLEKRKGTLFDKLASFIDSHAPNILKSEEIASSWACKWIEEKKGKGFDFWKSDDNHYWQQLDRALATYRNFFTIRNEAWSFKDDDADTYLEQWVTHMKEQYPHIVIENISKKNAETPSIVKEKNEDITNFW